MNLLFTLAILMMLTFVLSIFGSVVIFIIAMIQKRNKLIWSFNSFIMEFGLFSLSLYLFYYKFAPYYEKSSPTSEGQLITLGFFIVLLPVIHALIVLLYLLIKKPKNQK